MHRSNELPAPPDAAYIGIRRELTIETVKKLAAAGAGGCVCYAAGFAEIGSEGKALQEQLVEAAGEMPLVGPNCFGFVNYLDRCALWPYLFGGEPVERGVALISQSGNIAMNLTMNQRSVNFTHVIGAGNQAVLEPADYINALLNDDRVSVIGMYIEGFNDIDRFCRAAASALQKGIPIVVMKVGRTEASARQSSTHTSSLTGSDALYDALFDRLGIIRVNSLNRLLETLKILDLSPSVSGRNIFTLSCSGGEAAIAADLVSDMQLETAPFSQQQTDDLESQLPNYVTVSNPFDYNTSIWGDSDALRRCFTSTMQGNHDAAFLIYDHPVVVADEVDEWMQALDAFIAAHKATGKPSYVMCTISELLPESLRQHAISNGVVPLQGFEDGLYAYSQAASYYEYRDKYSGGVNLPRPAMAVTAAGGTYLDEHESKQQLEACGLTIPQGVAVNALDAVDAAGNLGYPVVVKALGQDLRHKSDLGAVALNLRDANAVEGALDVIRNSLEESGVSNDKFLVEKMVEGAIAELIVGVTRDDQFGPTLVIGAGGILVELISDSVSLLLPATRAEIKEAIGKLAISKLLSGYRGAAAADIDAMIDAVMAVASYAEANWDRVLELDVNPLLVLPEGRGAIAADALIGLSKEQ